MKKLDIKALKSLDNAAVKAGGYVVPPKEGEPKINIRAAAKYCEEVNRPLTKNELRKFYIA